MNNYLKNKKVLVTGGRGFVGSALIPKLRDLEANVKTFSTKEYDLRKEYQVKRLFEDTRPEVVIHLAVDGGGIGYMKENPGSIFYNNLMMNTLLQEQALRNDVKKFVGIGSVCAYPKFSTIPFKEENLWKGYPEETNAPYGLSKKMMMVQSQSYRRQYGFNAIHLLPTNLYGPGDDFDLTNSHVIPALIRKFIEAQKNEDRSIKLWGTGNASREFLYVDDVAEGIILATERYNKPRPVNLGSGSEIKIKDLAEKISEFTGYSGELIWDTSKPDGQPRRYLDTFRAKKEFGFVAKTSLEEGLKKTIEWYVLNK